VKNNHLIILAGIAIAAFCLFFLHPTTISATLLVDDNNDMTPVPYSNSSVYLSSERIVVTFDDRAHVNASYSFSNTADEAITFTILLPFASPPSYIDVRNGEDDEEIDFTHTQYFPEDSTNPAIVDQIIQTGFFDQLDTISFNFTFAPKQRKTINVTYTRDYIIQDPGPRSRFVRSDSTEKIHYHFMYIVSTGFYWNHSIDRAEFVFYIPSAMVDGFRNMNNFTIIEDDGWHVACTKRTNWTIENVSAYHFNEEISIWWYQKNDAQMTWAEEILDLRRLGGCMAIFIVFFIAFYLAYRMEKSEQDEVIKQTKVVEQSHTDDKHQIQEKK